jgi:hypothetical protein
MIVDKPAAKPTPDAPADTAKPSEPIETHLRTAAALLNQS